MSFVAVALIVSLAAPAFAQTPPPAGAKPQPPATPPAATQPAPKPAAPPLPFPQDSKIAFNDKKLAEINEKNKALQAAQTKLTTGGTVLSESARGELEKQIDRMQRDIQFTQQNAQAEMQELTNDLQTEFQKRLIPIIEEVAKEKGLYAVFSIADSGVAYRLPSLDISEEIVKRLDAKK
jgi:Skp family chaperone for outer membrane proteins